MQRKKVESQEKLTEIEGKSYNTLWYLLHLQTIAFTQSYLFSKAKINQINEKKKRRKHVTLLFAPRKTIKVFTYVLRDNALLVIDYFRFHKRLMAVLVALLFFGSILYVTPGDHQLVSTTLVAVACVVLLLPWV